MILHHMTKLHQHHQTLLLSLHHYHDLGQPHNHQHTHIYVCKFLYFVHQTISIVIFFTHTLPSSVKQPSCTHALFISICLQSLGLVRILCPTSPSPLHLLVSVVVSLPLDVAAFSCLLLLSCCIFLLSTFLLADRLQHRLAKARCQEYSYVYSVRARTHTHAHTHSLSLSTKSI